MEGGIAFGFIRSIYIGVIYIFGPITDKTVGSPRLLAYGYFYGCLAMQQVARSGVVFEFGQMSQGQTRDHPRFDVLLCEYLFRGVPL
jgi:hypothetical protein